MTTSETPRKTDDVWEAQCDWEDVRERRCRHYKRTFYGWRGCKVWHCPHCGAAQIRGTQTRLRRDPRWAQQL